MAFTSPVASTSRFRAAEVSGGDESAASLIFGIPQVTSTIRGVDVHQAPPQAAASSVTARWPPPPAVLSSPLGNWGTASSPPPPSGGVAGRSRPLTDTTNITTAGNVTPTQNNKQRLLRAPLTTQEIANAPRLVEPPPLDVDAFALEDLEPTEAQLQLAVQAAMHTAQLNSNVVNSINRLTCAARQQHADTLAVAQQQQRDAARLEAAWTVAASARTQASRVEAALDRSMRANDEVTMYVRMELSRHNTMLEQLLRRTRRNEAVLRNRAVDVLRTANRRILGTRVVSKWMRFTIVRRTCMHLLARTTQHTLRRRWRAWVGFVARRRQYRAWFRTLDYLEDKNNKALARRFVSRWIDFKKRRHTNRLAAERLGRQSARFVATQAFHRWIRYSKMRGALRTLLINQMSTTNAFSAKARANVQQRYFNKWAAYLVTRRDARRGNRLAHQLLVHVHAVALRKRFSVWATAAADRKRKRVNFVNLTRRNAGILGGKYFRIWERWTSRRWVIKYTAAQVAPIERKVDIGLRTTANTNETIQKLIENFQFLDAKLQEMRLGGRMGILGAREASLSANYAAAGADLPQFETSRGGLAAPPFDAGQFRGATSFPLPPQQQHHAHAAAATASSSSVVAGSLRSVHHQNPYLPGLGATEIALVNTAAATGVRSAHFGNGPIHGGVSGTTAIATPNPR